MFLPFLSYHPSLPLFFSSPFFCIDPPPPFLPGSPPSPSPGMLLISDLGCFSSKFQSHYIVDLYHGYLHISLRIISY